MKQTSLSSASDDPDPHISSSTLIELLPVTCRMYSAEVARFTLILQRELPA